MAASSSIYERAKQAYGDGATTAEVDFVNDTLKGLLVSSAYAPNYDTHAFLSDVPAGQRLGAAVACANKSWAKVGAGATAKRAFKSDKLTFAGNYTAGNLGAARGMVLYKDTGAEGTSLLLAYVLLDTTPADVSSATGIEVTPDATNGWLTVG